MSVNEEYLIHFENEYRKTIEVYCPYFKEKIAFNSKGLNHLKFKDERKSRPNEEYIVRVKISSLHR